jgi:hypothetical protein
MFTLSIKGGLGLSLTNPRNWTAVQIATHGCDATRRAYARSAG